MKTQIGGKSLFSLFIAMIVALGLVPQAAAEETEKQDAFHRPRLFRRRKSPMGEGSSRFR